MATAPSVCSTSQSSDATSAPSWTAPFWRPILTRRVSEEIRCTEFASLTRRVRILGEVDKSGAVQLERFHFSWALMEPAACGSPEVANDRNDRCRYRRMDRVRPFFRGRSLSNVSSFRQGKPAIEWHRVDARRSAVGESLRDSQGTQSSCGCPPRNCGSTGRTAHFFTATESLRCFASMPYLIRSKGRKN